MGWQKKRRSTLSAPVVRLFCWIHGQIKTSSAYSFWPFSEYILPVQTPYCNTSHQREHVHHYASIPSSNFNHSNGPHGTDMAVSIWNRITPTCGWTFINNSTRSPHLLGRFLSGNYDQLPDVCQLTKKRCLWGKARSFIHTQWVLGFSPSQKPLS